MDFRGNTHHSKGKHSRFLSHIYMHVIIYGLFNDAGTDTIQHRMVGRLLYNELEWMRKETVTS
jgi:hypothetical protein